MDRGCHAQSAGIVVSAGARFWHLGAFGRDPTTNARSIGRLHDGAVRSRQQVTRAGIARAGPSSPVAQVSHDARRLTTVGRRTGGGRGSSFIRSRRTLRAPRPPGDFALRPGRSPEPSRGTVLLWSCDVPTWCGPHAVARGQLVKPIRYSDKSGPQPPMDKPDLPVNQPTHEDIVAVADGSRHREDLTTLRMGPPATSNRFSSDDLSQ